MRAWCCPRWPTPITAIRRRVISPPSKVGRSREVGSRKVEKSKVGKSGGLLHGPADVTTCRLSTARRFGERPGQFHVQRVPGAVRDDVSGEVEPAQGEVADQV